MEDVARQTVEKRVAETAQAEQCSYKAHDDWTRRASQHAVDPSDCQWHSGDGIRQWAEGEWLA